MFELETPRLQLRHLEPADATNTYAGWMNDPEVNRYLETRHVKQTRASCRDFILQCNSDPCSELFGVFDKENGQHIGNAKIGFINHRYHRGQLSLFIGEKQLWGQGLSSELVRGLTVYGFERLGLHRLEAGCYEDNLASLRVFLKAGYVVEGFMRDHVVIDGRRTGCFWLGVLAREYPEQA
ncbi:N-acetyltransferase [Halopseudomonas laoshanensis]|uniref:N-acetyltransferase n=1 Tax=Halopseudomonas laoshanensis TaxID=2268758 RepID=A0A7V7GN69_9GAMM|nr:GNAT family protein [Halopseudomonas laoshanensis]KAA0690835.1 N-acetyltransferase [Halopseudomonas laoshanensis]